MEENTKRTLDRNHLNNFYQGITEGLDVIYDMFLDETPGNLVQAKEALLAGDHKAAADIIHAILPSFSTIGLPNLSASLRHVYNDLKAGKSFEALPGLEEFRAEFELYIPAIVEEQQRLKSLQ